MFIRIVQAAWITICTICLFSLTSAVIFAIWMAFAQPLKAAERPDHCLIGRVVYDQSTISQGHAFIFTLPKDLSRDFIIAWNAVMNGSQVPVTSDSVSLYNSPPAAFRIAFFRKGCLTESFELSEVGFWRVVGEASGSKREI